MSYYVDLLASEKQGEGRICTIPPKLLIIMVVVLVGISL